MQSLPVVHVPVAFFGVTHADDDVDPGGLVLPVGHVTHVLTPHFDKLRLPTGLVLPKGQAMHASLLR